MRRVNPGGNVVWVARYTGSDGKRRSAGSFKLKRDAQDAIAAAYEAEPGSGKAITIGEYAANWTARRPRSLRTDETYDNRVAAVLGPVTDEQLRKGRLRARRARKPFEPWQGVELEGRPMRDWLLPDFKRRQAVTLVDILLTQQKRSALGAKGILLTLSAMWSDAIDDEHVEANPFSNVKVRQNDPRITKQRKPARIVSWQDMHRLAVAAGEHEAMVRVVSDCGLRLGEMLALYREDMKLGRCDEPDCAINGSHFHVRRTTYKGVVTVGTKRERLRGDVGKGRVVPFGQGLEDLLRALPRRIDTPLLFPTRLGKVYLHGNFREHIWNPARKATGVAASPHDFRHSWVSHMRAARIDPADLAEMAGHTVIVADAVYTHSLLRSFDAMRDAVGK